MDEAALRQFCDRWMAAWTGNRPERLIEFYAEDALYRDPARPHGLRGREEIYDYFVRLLARNPDWRWSVVDVWPLPGEGFVLKWRAHIPVGERFVEEVGVDLCELRDGRLWRNEVYFDRSAWHEAAAAEASRE